MAEPALVGLTYACQRLGISRNFGHNLATKGEFPVRIVKIGNRMKVHAQELEDFIAGTTPREGQAAT